MNKEEISVHSFTYVRDKNRQGTRKTIGYVTLDFGNGLLIRDCRVVESADLGVMVYGPSKQIRANEMISVVEWDRDTGRHICSIVHAWMQKH